MSVLIHLPQDVFNSLLCDWCDLVDIVLIDFAITGRHRSVFHEKIRALPNYHVKDYDLFLAEALNWVFLREIRLRNLILHAGLFDQDKRFVARLVFSNVLHLELDSFVSQLGDVTGIIDSCHSLSSIKCSSCKIFSSLKPELLKRLRVCMLHVSACQDQDSFLDALQCIEQHCRQLKTLHVDGPSYGLKLSSDGTLYANILQVNPALTELQLVGCMDDLSTACQLCPKLKSLAMEVNELNASNAIKLFISHPSLSHCRVVRSCSFLFRSVSSVTCSVVHGKRTVKLVNCEVSDSDKESLRVVIVS